MRDEAKYRPLRAKARALIVKDGLTQKEVAELLQIAPKTVSEWYNRKGWKDEREEHLEKGGKVNSLYDFIAFVRDHHQSSFPTIESLYKSYLNIH